MKDDRVYLEHILDSIRRIESYTAAGASEFMASTVVFLLSNSEKG